MKDYFDNPEATRSAIDFEGWLHTGDLGSLDEHGYCRVQGRRKEMIIRGGENIYPREIEDVLYTHPAVMGASIVGNRTANGAKCPSDLSRPSRGMRSPSKNVGVLSRTPGLLQGPPYLAVRRPISADRIQQDSEVRSSRTSPCSEGPMTHSG